MRYNSTHVFDGRGCQFEVRHCERPGFLKDDDPQTINIVFDEEHYQVL